MMNPDSQHGFLFGFDMADLCPKLRPVVIALAVIVGALTWANEASARTSGMKPGSRSCCLKPVARACCCCPMSRAEVSVLSEIPRISQNAIASPLASPCECWGDDPVSPAPVRASRTVVERPEWVVGLLIVPPPCLAHLDTIAGLTAGRLSAPLDFRTARLLI